MTDVPLQKYLFPAITVSYTFFDPSVATNNSRINFITSLTRQDVHYIIVLTMYLDTSTIKQGHKDIYPTSPSASPIRKVRRYGIGR